MLKKNKIQEPFQWVYYLLKRFLNLFSVFMINWTLLDSVFRVLVKENPPPKNWSWIYSRRTFTWRHVSKDHSLDQILSWPLTAYNSALVFWSLTLQDIWREFQKDDLVVRNLISLLCHDCSRCRRSCLCTNSSLYLL